MKRWVKSELLSFVQSKTIICLSGEMGAGKTEVVKTVCTFLGFEPAQSPTFGLAHLYENQNSQLKLYHVDLYRMQSQEDLDSTGFWDLFNDSKAAVFIEWADFINQDQWPWDWKRIKIDIVESNLQARIIKLHFL